MIAYVNIDFYFKLSVQYYFASLLHMLRRAPRRSLREGFEVVLNAGMLIIDIAHVYMTRTAEHVITDELKVKLNFKLYSRLGETEY